MGSRLEYATLLLLWPSLMEGDMAEKKSNKKKELKKVRKDRT